MTFAAADAAAAAAASTTITCSVLSGPATLGSLMHIYSALLNSIVSIDSSNLPLRMNRRVAPLAIVISVASICAALVLVASTQRAALVLLEPAMDDITSAFSETDRASQVLAHEGGLDLVGRDYQVRVLVFFL
jgi:hypothetical protein